MKSPASLTMHTGIIITIITGNLKNKASNDSRLFNTPPRLTRPHSVVAEEGAARGRAAGMPTGPVAGRRC